jgi:hypothetical protein
MFARGASLCLAAILAMGVMAQNVGADHERGHYRGPPIIREIPGLRILFGDYALSEEEFDARYGTPPQRVKRNGAEEPAPRKPARKEAEREKPAPKSKTATKPEKPAGEKKTAAAQGLSCEQGASVVAGYGFSGVAAASCAGRVYAFNAMRDGKSFTVKLDSASGELTEVKKLP